MIILRKESNAAEITRWESNTTMDLGGKGVWDRKIFLTQLRVIRIERWSKMLEAGERALSVAAWWGRTELRLLVVVDRRERPSLLPSYKEEMRLVASEFCCSCLKRIWCSHAANNGFYAMHKTHCFMQSFVRILAPYV